MAIRKISDRSSIYGVYRWDRRNGMLDGHLATYTAGQGERAAQVAAAYLSGPRPGGLMEIAVVDHTGVLLLAQGRMPTVRVSLFNDKEAAQGWGRHHDVSVADITVNQLVS